MGKEPQSKSDQSKSEKTQDSEAQASQTQAPEIDLDNPEIDTSLADAVVDGLLADDPLAAALTERDELKDQLLRALAEMENMRRSNERELQNARKYGHLSFARDILTSIDNLSQAVALAPTERSELGEGLQTLLIGVEMIHNELRAILERHHIKQISAEGEKFNYNLHQAMFEVPTDKVAAGHVVQVAQPGYQLHDRLLRPAMVGVSKPLDATDVTDADKKDTV